MRPDDAGGAGLAAALAREHFEVEGKDLLVGGIPVKELIAQVGTPAYLYDAGVMRRTYARLARAVSDADLHYSVKANPASAVIRVFVEAGAGVEIASAGEYRRARAAGADPRRILYAGPGKRLRELEETIGGGIGEVHLESYEEIARVAAIGRRLGNPVAAALRVNPLPTSQAGSMRMGGRPAAFGFDEEDAGRAVAAIERAGHIRLQGIHVFAGTQILDAAALIAQWRHAIGIAGAVARLIPGPLRTIDLGGGLGIRYFSGDRDLDLGLIEAEFDGIRGAVAAEPLLAGARIVLEPGRFLAGPAGLYVAEVNAVKDSRGARFLVTDGGMHHHLAASGNLGQIIKRDYPMVAPARMNEPPAGPVSVVGPLCTPLDTLAREAWLPELGAGDLVAILQSGAYGATASPGRFLSHPPPAEVLVDEGRVEVIAAAW